MPIGSLNVNHTSTTPDPSALAISDQGRQAALAGVVAVECPYWGVDWRRNVWMQGFRLGIQERIQRKAAGLPVIARAPEQQAAELPSSQPAESGVPS